MAAPAAQYSGNPASGPRDLIRHLIGDTGLDRQFFLSDAEIDFEIAENVVPATTTPRPYRTAVACVDRIVGRVAQRVDVVDGDARAFLSKQIENFEKLRDRLTVQANVLEGGSALTALPVLAGLVAQDTGPYFELGMHDAPGNQSAHVDHGAPPFDPAPGDAP